MFHVPKISRRWNKVLKKITKHRSWMMILYPENSNHCKIINSLASYRSVYILHDKDDIEEEFINDDGKEKKKKHWHVLICFDNNRYRNPVAEEIGLDEKEIHLLVPCHNVIGYLKYMIHYGYDKYEYDIGELNGDANLIFKLKKAIKNDGVDEEKKVLEIISYIDSKDNKITVSDVADFCVKNGYWDVFRRSAIVFVNIVKERNYRERKR